MLILDKLWDGELSPAGRRILDPAYSKALAEASRAEDALLDALPPEASGLFDRYDNTLVDLHKLLERDAFFTGFCMAGLLMMDILRLGPDP